MFSEKTRPRGTKRYWMILPVLLAALLLCAAKRETELTVALFPYVPDEARFQQKIEAAWNELHPEVELNFVSWDCYLEDPAEDLDVFVYDAIYLHDFLEKGYLLPIPEESIRDIDDFFPSALSACRSDGITYALPQLLCTNLLYAWEGDTELRDVKNVYELYELIGEADSGAGLLVPLPDAVTLPLWYLEVKTDLDQSYSETFVYPDGEDLDPKAMEILNMIQEMADDASAAASDGARQTPRSARFADGCGRAFIGYSEDMYNMGGKEEKMVFHRLSLSEGDDIPMMYADIASVNAKISDDKREYALELLNVLTGRETLKAIFSPSDKDQSPQYLLGARASIFDELAEDYPIYGRLKTLVSDPACRIITLRPSGRDIIAKGVEVFSPLLPAWQAA